MTTPPLPPKRTVNPVVFLDVSITGREEPAHLEFELYADDAPYAAENFFQLCKGEKNGINKSGITYKGCRFHRIIPEFMIQGGDITKGNGTGGRSIWGDKFTDEFRGKAGKHTGLGCLSMANSGPDTNGSQFFICVADTKWLDRRHTVFGRLVNGAEEALKEIEACGSAHGETGAKKVVIQDCGVVSE